MALNTNPPSIPSPSPSCPLLRLCGFPISKIQVKVDFGTASKHKTAAMDYTWGSLNETVLNRAHPSSLIPGNGSQRVQPSQKSSSTDYQDQQQNSRLRIIRQRSASELSEGRNSIVSPVSPLSPVSTEFSSYQPTPQRRPEQPRVVPPQFREPTRLQQQTRGMTWSLQTSMRGASSPWSPQQARASSWSPQRFSPLSPYDDRDKPLPPLPSMGYSARQDESPWTFESPPWASPVQQRPRPRKHRKSRPRHNNQTIATSRSRSQPANQTTPTFTDPEVLVLPSETRLEDPQRIHNLSQLQEAMMTIDSLDGDFPVQEFRDPQPHRGPRGLGWAITRNDFNTNSGEWPPPPSYAFNPWESHWEELGLRRCSSAC